MGLLKSIRQKIFRVSDLKKGLFNLHSLKKIPSLPESLTNENGAYEIIGDLVVANIQKKIYRVGEPVLSNREKEILSLIKQGLYEVINLDASEKIEEYIEKSTRVIISELDIRLSDESMKKILYYIYRDLIGLGKIEPILLDELVSEFHFDKGIIIKHKIYGMLNLDLPLNEIELAQILRKLSLNCGEELTDTSTSIKCSYNNLIINLEYSPEAIEESKFSIKKEYKKYPSPIRLVQDRKISPEILAFLWMAMEDKNNLFFVNDNNFLNMMSFFLPNHTKILTNIPDYYPNIYTDTYLGNKFGEEDFALIDNFSGEAVNGVLLTTLESVEESGNIICYIENGKIQKILEDGKEIFGLYEEKFLFNLSNSNYIKSRGNSEVLKDEFNTRTNFLMVLIKNNTSEIDFRKLINLYYQNPVAVLKRAGIV